MRTVRVVPVPGGWLVESDLAMPTLFFSGGAAEKKAKELGHLLSGDRQAQVLIHDRSGTLVGSTVIGTGIRAEGVRRVVVGGEPQVTS